MAPFVIVANYIFASLTIVGHLILVGLLFAYFFKKENILKWFGTYALPFAFLISLIATLGSLFYSEIANFTPCKFCWFERIFMYPLPLLFGIALWKKDRMISMYTIPMVVIGGLIAANHYMLQMTGTSVLPCSAVGQSVDCGKRFVILFNYITIPMMCLTAFGLILASLLVYKKQQRA